jgi:Peptidase A4 family
MPKRSIQPYLFQPLAPATSRSVPVGQSANDAGGYKFVRARLIKTRFSNGPSTERSGQPWSGALFTLDRAKPPVSAAAHFSSVRGRWVIPNIALADLPSVFTRTKGNEVAQGYYSACSTWVGFNGSSKANSDPAHLNGALWQGGAQSNISISDGTVNHYSWFQVLGPHGTGPEFNINFEVTAGDLLDVEIEDVTTPLVGGSLPFSTYQGGARCTYINHTQRTFTKFEFYCQDPIYARQVEWIVERPQVKGGLAWMPRFGSVFFSNAECRYNDIGESIAGLLVQPGSLPSVFADRSVFRFANQNDSAKKVLTETSVVSPGIVRVEYTYAAG